VTGDWVLATPTDPAMIVEVLPRRTLFARAAENGERQPMAANIDVALLVTGLDGDFNLKRLDRYLVLAKEAGARPVAVLNKRDVCSDAEERLAQASAIAPAVLVSALHDDVPAVMAGVVMPGETAALFGSSGAGKSTLLNALSGQTVQDTTPVREWDSRGRHTTTTRSLYRMPQGWLLLDMPGIRAVGIGGSQEAVDAAFDEIAVLAKECRYRDCSHQGEPGCAVEGVVDPGRLASYHKLIREAAYQHRKEDVLAAQALKQRWKRIHVAMRKRPDKRS
jgi:ribosome biogenesis GTPase